MPAAYILIATASGFLITPVSEFERKMLIYKGKTTFFPKNSSNYSLSKSRQRPRIHHNSLLAELPLLITGPVLAHCNCEVSYIHSGIAIDCLGECILLLSEVELTALAKSVKLIEAQLASSSLLNHYKALVFNLVPRAYTTMGVGRKTLKNKQSTIS